MFRGIVSIVRRVTRKRWIKLPPAIVLAGC